MKTKATISIDKELKNRIDTKLSGEARKFSTFVELLLRQTLGEQKNAN